ncbi:beta strand repeat-containing protein [Sphingomonas sp.]|uniref:beta strand repeat-containing protein n=1 Tax=Sphingomonas sp. TaxID=28214 RepID=UPI003D6D13D7
MANYVGGGGDDTFTGTSANDTAVGNGGKDLLTGEGGNDRLEGNDGNDELRGGSGNDMLIGGDGSDMIHGDGGADTMLGGDGDDFLYVQEGDLSVGDVYDGGAGFDTLYVQTTADLTNVNLSGIELIHSLSDTVTISTAQVSGFAQMNGDFVFGNGGSVSFAGIKIDFNSHFSLAAAGNNVDFSGAIILSPFNPSFSGIAAGGRIGNDTITGTALDDYFDGGEGNDTLNGGDGADKLLGGSGNGADTINGGAGNDTIEGGAGADIINGGAGDDTITISSTDQNLGASYNGGSGFDSLHVQSPLGADFSSITLTGIERLTAGTLSLRADQLMGLSEIDSLNLTLTTGGTVSLAGIAVYGDTILLANATNIFDLTGTVGVSHHRVYGGDGNDTIISGETFDSFFGGGGNDVLIAGGSLSDGLTGDAGNDQLWGGAADDYLDGGDDNDLLHGGLGNDRLLGGLGTDTATYADASGAVTVNLYSGTVSGAAGLDQISSVENVIGSAYADTLTGGAEVNLLQGMNGNDILDGGAGSDRLEGGKGNDTYYVDNAGDSVWEAAGEGNDTVFASASFALGAGQEIETLATTSDAGTDAINLTGNEFANTVRGNAGNNRLDGGAGGDRLTGGAGDDRYIIDNSLDRVIENANEGIDTVESSVTFSFVSLAALENLTLTGIGTINGTGNALANILIGNAAANVLDGGTGIDRMEGGAGNDTYYVDLADDIVREAAGEGDDTVLTARSYALAAGQEIETLATINDAGTGFINLTGNEFANTLRGNAGGNILDGGLGADRMSGGLGNDTYVVDNAGDQAIELSGGGTDTIMSSISFSLADAPEVENLTLTGVGSLTATGNALNNILIGNAGANYLTGGLGADRMEGGAGDDTYYADTSDTLVEAVGAGVDTAYVTTSYTLAAGVEIERLWVLDRTATGALDLTGNGFANWLIGNAGANRLDGGLGNDVLEGGAGNDLLLGGDGNDSLSGGLGSDELRGGRGDDSYYLDDLNDTIIEAAGEGSDTINASLSFILAAGLQIEVLNAYRVDGSGNALAMDLTGNEYQQSINGNNAGNVLSGLGGMDYLYGNGGGDTLYGGEGNDVLDGGTGGDRMYGGTGDDSYFIESSLDRVIELDGEGLDTVFSTVSFSLVGSGVEQLFLSGDAAINATGNALNNNMRGNVAANILDGGIGNDQMLGGAGDDIYYVDVAGDTVVEQIGDGNDTVLTARTYALGGGQEIETLATANDAGTGFINLTGNEFANTLRGNAGGNRLDGWLGSDTLTGLGGADTFVFDTALGATNVDTITDFVHGTDRIELDQSIFTGLGLGTLGASAFGNGPATTADQHILYDAATGKLSYDADGSGAGAAIVFATLSNHPATITSADFLIVP